MINFILTLKIFIIFTSILSKKILKVSFCYLLSVISKMLFCPIALNYFLIKD